MNGYIDPGTSIDLPLIEADGVTTIEDGPLEVKRSVLPTGIRILTQHVPGTRAATIGYWVPVGSRDEADSQGGASHFLEHLLFKGTKTRTALEIATAFDEVGGESNAATAKETTNYWAKVLDADAPMALSTLTDMVTSSVLADTDIETERTVIIDELAMSEDSPAEVVHEAFSLAVHGDTALGRPIGGTTTSVESISADEIRSLYHTRYDASSLIVCAAGNVNHEEIRDHLENALVDSAWDLRASRPQPRRSSERARNLLDQPAQSEIVVTRDVEQAHILVGGAWLDARSQLRPVSTVLLTVLGGGMSSRLFQEIREKRGLAYTTYAFDVAYSDTGVFGMYAGCAPHNVAEVEKIMWAEVEKLAEGQLSEEEVVRAQGQIRGGVALGMEDSNSRMGRLGRSEVVGQFFSVDAALERIQAVTVSDIAELAKEMIQVQRSRALVLPNSNVL